DKKTCDNSRMQTINTKHETNSCPSPVPTGEVSAQQTEGASSSPLPTLTNALLEDLLNPSITAFDLCQIHRLSMSQLADLLDSDKYHQLVNNIERISKARIDLVTAESSALATARL